MDGHQALQYEIMGRVEGEDLAYLFTVVRGDDHMYQVLAWTVRSEWEAKEELLREVTSRVEELPSEQIGGRATFAIYGASNG